MKQRMNAFGVCRSAVSRRSVINSGDSAQSFVEEVLRRARNALELLNRKLCV